jgi:fructokinase
MILACGEALIDMLPRETAAGEAAFAPYPGGAVFNTAIALGRLGANVGYFSGLSSDLFGQMLREALEASNVDASAAHISDRPTTLAFVRLVDGHATYAFYDENTAGRMLTPADLPETHADALFFGGISLVGEPSGSTYEALMAREAPRRVIAIDPNIRPSFITDAPAFRARLDRMLAMADIVKLSDEDLRWLLGDVSIEDGAREVLARGAKVVLITEGAKGAHGFMAGVEMFVPARKVAVVDTVGAGDTFNAGVLASLWRQGCLSKTGIETLGEAALRHALNFGAQAAAVTVSRAGANPPWEREL